MKFFARALSCVAPFAFVASALAQAGWVRAWGDAAAGLPPQDLGQCVSVAGGGDFAAVIRWGDQPMSGGACNDGDFCTTGETCKTGVCQGGKPTLCNDNNPCTADTCDAKAGQCAAKPLTDGTTCSDGNDCTQGDACKAGQCAGGAEVKCDDLEPCTADSCNPVSGKCQFLAIAGCGSRISLITPSSMVKRSATQKPGFDMSAFR